MFHGTTPFPTVYVRKAADMPVPGAMTRFRPGPSGGVPTPRPMGPPASLGLRSTEPGIGGMWACRPSVSKKSFRHAVRIFKLSKKFKNTCRLNAKGAEVFRQSAAACGHAALRRSARVRRYMRRGGYQPPETGWGAITTQPGGGIAVGNQSQGMSRSLRSGWKTRRIR